VFLQQDREMTVSREERNRILNMVESGQVSAEEAAQLFDALLEEPARSPSPALQNRTVRIWVTDTATRSRKVNMTATLPVSVLRAGFQAFARVVPALRDGRIETILRSLESGMTGRVMDLQDLEDGKRVEIFIEQ
jgi:polyhydroxyalkanoate synthesis regulator phasin